MREDEVVIIGPVYQLLGRINRAQFSSIFLLTDENTDQHCKPLFLNDTGLKPTASIVIPAGEIHKNLASCEGVWRELMAHGADRSSLLIILGGGVVGDLGGFCASTYMRGIAFMQVPTSLLAQVDASIGGKTGVDFNLYKNMIGTFSTPMATVIDTRFLRTLPARDMNNGFVEMLKHGLIADPSHWQDVLMHEDNEIESLIRDSIQIKQNIVALDPFEQKQRRALNFGHTIGHALERAALSLTIDIRHGEAVAFGVMAAAVLSREVSGLPTNQADMILDEMMPYCGYYPAEESIPELIQFIKLDKKGVNQRVGFTLLKQIGEAVVDVEIEEASIRNCILHCIHRLNKCGKTEQR